MPRADGLIPRPGKQNVGNRTPRESKQDGWRASLSTMRRVEMVSTLWLMGHRGQLLLDRVNAWLMSNGQPSISNSTLVEDRKRMLIIVREYEPIMASEHVAAINLLKLEAWRQLASSNTSPQVQAGALREAREAELLLMKLSGAIDERNVVNVGVSVQPREEITFIDPESPSLRAALLLLRGDEPKLLTDGTDGDESDG